MVARQRSRLPYRRTDWQSVVEEECLADDGHCLEPRTTTRFSGRAQGLPITVILPRPAPLEQDGATYFVTFRLGDSLPSLKLRNWKRSNASGRGEAAFAGRIVHTRPQIVNGL